MSYLFRPSHLLHTYPMGKESSSNNDPPESDGRCWELHPLSCPVLHSRRRNHERIRNHWAHLQLRHGINRTHPRRPRPRERIGEYDLCGNIRLCECRCSGPGQNRNRGNAEGGLQYSLRRRHYRSLLHHRTHHPSKYSPCDLWRHRRSLRGGSLHGRYHPWNSPGNSHDDYHLYYGHNRDGTVSHEAKTTSGWNLAIVPEGLFFAFGTRYHSRGNPDWCGDAYGGRSNSSPLHDVSRPHVSRTQ